MRGKLHVATRQLRRVSLLSSLNSDPEDHPSCFKAGTQTPTIIFLIGEIRLSNYLSNIFNILIWV